MIDRWKFTFFPFWIFSLRDFYEFLIFIAAQDFPGQVALFPICGATKGFWRSGSCNFLTRNHDDWSAPKSPQPPQLQDVRVVVEGITGLLAISSGRSIHILAPRRDLWWARVQAIKPKWMKLLAILKFLLDRKIGQGTIFCYSVLLRGYQVNSPVQATRIPTLRRSRVSLGWMRTRCGAVGLVGPLGAAVVDPQDTIYAMHFDPQTGVLFSSGKDWVTVMASWAKRGKLMCQMNSNDVFAHTTRTWSQYPPYYSIYQTISINIIIY